MKFAVNLTQSALNDLNSPEKQDRNKALKTFDIISNVDIEAVVTKPLT